MLYFSRSNLILLNDVENSMSCRQRERKLVNKQERSINITQHHKTLKTHHVLMKYPMMTMRMKMEMEMKRRVKKKILNKAAMKKLNY